MSKQSNDNEVAVETAITKIIAAISLQPCHGTMAELRRIVTMYAEIERNRVFRDVLAIEIDVHTSLSDYCAKIRALAEVPYRAL